MHRSDLIKSRARHITRKGKKGSERWNPGAQRTSHAGDPPYDDQKNSREAHGTSDSGEDPETYTAREAGMDRMQAAQTHAVHAPLIEHASTTLLPSVASFSRSPPPPCLPESRIASTPASGNPCRPSPRSSTPGKVSAILPASTSDPHFISTHISHNHTTTVSATATLESREVSGCSQQDLCDNVFGVSDTVANDPSTLGREDTPLGLDEAPLSEDGLLSLPEGASELSPLISSDATDEDFIRDILIICKSGDGEYTRLYRMKIDTANEHENLITRRVVDENGFPRSHRKPSVWKQMLNALAPWTDVAKAAKEQAGRRLLNYDGTVIRGQDGIVEISWFVQNQEKIRDPFLFFNQARRYSTTHVVTDAPKNGYDIVLSWKEVERLKLRQRHAAPIYRPPTPKSDPGNMEYLDYEKRKAKNKAARDEKRGSNQVQPLGATSANKTDKQLLSQS